MVPRVAYPVGADQQIVREYLERAVWPDVREAAREHGHAAGLTADGLVRVDTLLTPGRQGYIVDERGYYVVHPALLVTGRQPRDPTAASRSK